MRARHARRSLQRLLHMVLTRGASHPQDRQNNGFSHGFLLIRRSFHARLPIHMGRIPRLAESSQSRIHGGGLIGRAESCRAKANFLHLDSSRRIERLRHSANAGAAVHPIDAKMNFSHSQKTLKFKNTPIAAEICPIPPSQAPPTLLLPPLQTERLPMKKGFPPCTAGCLDRTALQLPAPVPPPATQPLEIVPGS